MNTGLKQVDYDGRYTYSNYRDSSREEERSVLRVYPEPSHEMQTSCQWSIRVKVDINVYDNVGRLVLGHVYNDIMEGSDMKTQISRNDLSNGVYHVPNRRGRRATQP